MALNILEMQSADVAQGFASNYNYSSRILSITMDFFIAPVIFDSLSNELFSYLRQHW